MRDAGTRSSRISGRVVGLFLQVAGTFGALGPWVMGAWADHLKDSHIPSNYFGPFAAIAISMLIASATPPLITRLGTVLSAIKPLQEISPETMGAVP